MRKNHFSLFILLSFLLTCLNLLSKQSVLAMPLYTQSRWIVDEDGDRVKLACVNWPSHLEPMLAEGLSKKPLNVISKKIRSMGFNCVRFTWPVLLAANESIANNVTVYDSFQSLGMNESLGAIQVNNPSFLNLTLIQAYQTVVRNLGDNDVMVILDNHISKPGWCCNSIDGNGFFGDLYFDPKQWLKGLNFMATLFNGTKNVIGMSLRNELRGPMQNVSEWYRYMQQGAETVHAANPNMLVILSGLSFDKDLSFLKTQPVNITITNARKLVFEVHWYGVTDGDAWEKGNPNEMCGRLNNNFMNDAGFLLDKGYPLFVSEFGGDLRGSNVNDNRFLNCMFGILAELDLDWAWWTLQGSYYLRQGVYAVEEVYGVLTWDWCGIRNVTFMEKFYALQSPFRGPGVSPPSTPSYHTLFHPSSGFCVFRKSARDVVRLGPCRVPMSWIYTPEKTIMLMGTYYCLQAMGLGLPPILGVRCGGPNSKWDMISDSKMHLSTKLWNEEIVCLDIGYGGVLVTNECKCLKNDNTCDPASQWFKMVNSTKIPPSWKTSSSTTEFPLEDLLEQRHLSSGIIGSPN